MLKHLVATLLFLSPLPALAIAPGVEQANYCANYTADRFRLTINDVSITNFRQSGSNFEFLGQFPTIGGGGIALLANITKWCNIGSKRTPTAFR